MLVVLTCFSARGLLVELVPDPCQRLQRSGSLRGSGIASGLEERYRLVMPSQREPGSMRVGLAGYLAQRGYAFGVVEAIAMTICIGLACDYCVQVVQASAQPSSP